MAKAGNTNNDPRVQLEELERFVSERKAQLLPEVEKLEAQQRAKAEEADAAKLETLRAEASEAAAYLISLAARIDAKMLELHKLLVERRDAGAEFARQFDKRVVWVGHQFSYPRLIGSALHASGVGAFAHISDRGKLTLEFQDRQMLGGLLKGDGK